MTLEEFVKRNKGIIKQMNGGKEILEYLEELKKLREENESLRNDIKAYEEIIESEIGFGEGEEENDT